MVDVRKADHGSTDYYRPPHFIAIILVPIGMTLTTMAALSPQLLPYAYMGPLGNFVKYMVQNQPGSLLIICTVAWIIHLGEAVYAGKLCSDKGIEGTAKLMWILHQLLF